MTYQAQSIPGVKVEKRPHPLPNPPLGKHPHPSIFGSGAKPVITVLHWPKL